MDALTVRGGKPLNGLLQLPGGKNAALPLMAAAVLTEGKTVLRNVPRLTDVDAMSSLLHTLGVKTRRENDILTIDAGTCCGKPLPPALMQKLRASNLLWGPLLDRCGKVCLPLSGGCAIGKRPLDLHIKGMKALGVTVKETADCLISAGENRRGARIVLDYPSVGATENLLMAAVRAKGETVIVNAAREPEVAALCRFLNDCGGNIRGIGTDVLVIMGVKRLYPAEATVIADRIVGGTALLGAFTAGGTVAVQGMDYAENLAFWQKLRELGGEVTVTPEAVRVKSLGRNTACSLRTLPHPGFPTDLQPQFTAALATAEGTSAVTETVFENRFTQISELKKMGADITQKGKTVLIRGVPKLHGAAVEAKDLRCGAALVLAALGAEGETAVVSGVECIDRGYEDIAALFSSLGADIANALNG